MGRRSLHASESLVEPVSSLMRGTNARLTVAHVNCQELLRWEAFADAYMHIACVSHPSQLETRWRFVDPRHAGMQGQDFCFSSSCLLLGF